MQRTPAAIFTCTHLYLWYSCINASLSPPPPSPSHPAMSCVGFFFSSFLCCRHCFCLNHTGPSNSDHLWLSSSESIGLVLKPCTKKVSGSAVAHWLKWSYRCCCHPWHFCHQAAKGRSPLSHPFKINHLNCSFLSHHLGSLVREHNNELI